MSIIHSTFREAARNAAWEEYLFRRRPVRPALLFYRNDPAVLWGRNQNPYLECDVAKCRREGVSLLRRISGGGTVYHDQGNLNYCFILPRGACELGQPEQLLCQALQELGLTDLHICARHSLWLDDRKISGSAFALSGPAILQHGCLLLNSDLTRLQELLTTTADASSASRVVASVRSPVANISEFQPTVRADEVKAALSSVAQTIWPEIAQAEDNPDWQNLLAPYEEKFASEIWTMEMAVNDQRP